MNREKEIIKNDQAEIKRTISLLEMKNIITETQMV